MRRRKATFSLAPQNSIAERSIPHRSTSVRSADTITSSMKRLLAIVLAVAALTPSLVPAPAAASEEDLPQVRCDGRRLMFGWHGGAPHRIDVSNLIRAASLQSVHVLTAKREGDVDYFVVTVSGPSWSGAAPTGTGGTESSLLWLKLKSWKVIDAQAMLYQSFLDSLEPIGEYHFKGGILTVRYANKRESVDYVLRYDSSRPDAKISLARANEVE
jgi:hypothetical protein